MSPTHNHPHKSPSYLTLARRETCLLRMRCQRLLRMQRQPLPRLCRQHRRMNKPGGLARIRVLGAIRTPKDGPRVNGGRQPHQSMLLDAGASCSLTTTLGARRASALPFNRATRSTGTPKA
eukprot:3556981-Pyramimonas_sp.AAC.1